MREKSDFKKMVEGRCLGTGADYISWIEASESHTHGYACRIPDPVNGRNVNTLSTGESYYYWLFRFNKNVSEIREQMVVPIDVAQNLCKKHGFRRPSKALSIDFFIDYRDGRKMGYSIKESKKDLDPGSARNPKARRKIERELEKHIVCQEFCQMIGRGFEVRFKDEIDHRVIANIKTVMACFDINTVSEPDHMYRYLIAHGYITVDLTKGYIPFADIARKNRKDIEEYFMEVVRYAQQEYQPR